MKRLSTIISLLAMVLMVSQVLAQSMPTDPIGGKPPAGSKPSVTDLDYQVKYHRAFCHIRNTIDNLRCIIKIRIMDIGYFDFRE